MRIQVIDVGNSYLKNHIWDVADGRDSKLMHGVANETSRDMQENLEIVRNYYDKSEKEGVIILSMGDSVVYETKNGEIEWLPYDTQPHDYAHNIDMPPFVTSGLSQRGELKGSFYQLMMLRTRPSIHRILPMSAFIAAWLAEEKNFMQWDRTHVSNSGAYNYQTADWDDCVKDLINKGVIDKKILSPKDTLRAPDGTSILIGGHDSTFANATDIPYSTAPYISCGTWTTVSVESGVSRTWRNRGQRYVVAPNGTVLEQLCFKSKENPLEATNQIIDFLNKKFNRVNAPPIRVFGAHGREMHKLLTAVAPKYEFGLLHEHYLTEHAARFASGHLKATGKVI